MVINKRDVIAFGSLILVMGMYVAYTFFQIKYQGTGVDYQDISSSIERLKLENSLMQTEIHEASSYQTISKKAESMGFRNPTEKDYIRLK